MQEVHHDHQWVLASLHIRWVSVVEFHDPTLSIGKVFGQESTVVKWNYQILGLHQVTVCQKLGVILVIKWFKNWSQQKMLFYKKGAPKLIFFDEFFFFFYSNDFWHRKFTLKVQFQHSATSWQSYAKHPRTPIIQDYG